MKAIVLAAAIQEKLRFEKCTECDGHHFRIYKDDRWQFLPDWDESWTK